MKHAISCVLLMCALLLAPQSLFAANLTNISHEEVGDKVRVRLSFDEQAPAPLSFTITDPARIALDFPETNNLLSSKTYLIESGATKSITSAQAKGRTRVVINLDKLVDYQTDVQGNDLILTLASNKNTGAIAKSSPTFVDQPQAVNNSNGISNIDFRRSRDGAGRILISLNNPQTAVDVKQQGSRVIVDLKNTQMPANLQQRYDVLDFATPVETIEASSSGNNSKLVIKASGNFTQLAYQSENVYTIEVRPVTKTAIAKKKEKAFTGQKLSLNFQDIEVRSVLQLIADFTGLNVVVSDSVEGNVTLQLKNVPWDQALDIILQTKGLDKRQKGNVILIAPAAEIAARESAELQAAQQVTQLAPLQTELFRLNYADAEDMATLLEAQLTQSGGSSENPEISSNAIISSRGSYSIDVRTNTLIIQDVAASLDNLRNLINELDVAVRQVMIEARIVNASDIFTRELGISWGISETSTSNSGDKVLTNRFTVNAPPSNSTGTIGFSFQKIPFGTQVDLTLSAAEAENKAEIVASPRIIASNKTEALIQQGVEIPYTTSEITDGVETTKVTFKEALLELKVTPQITNDDQVNMKLFVTRDTRGEETDVGFAINRRTVETQVLVDNGQTLVLGGIYEEQDISNENKIPILGDIPILGYAFKNDLKRKERQELMIFVTPKIINEELTLR